MAAIEWIRFLIGAFLLLFGLFIFAIEMVGVFRFKYVLNRMHAAAMGDTLGIGFSLVGLIVMNGLNFTSLKLFCVIVFLWFASPTSSHLIARLEVTTDEEPEKHYRRIKLSDGEKSCSRMEMSDGEKSCRRMETPDGEKNYSRVETPDGEKSCSRVETPDAEKHEAASDEGAAAQRKEE